MSAISAWSTTAASNNAESPDGFKENMFPSQVNDSAREVMAAVRTWYENTEWRDWGHTVTYASATTFTVAGDVTAIYEANRPIRCTDSSTLYGYVASSSYSNPNTTVTVTLDSGSLSASLASVALGPSPSQKSIPAQALRGSAEDTLTIHDPADTTKKIRLDAGSISTATTRVVTVPDRDITLADPLTSGTSQATTSGTAIDFTGIPSWVKKITISIVGVSTSGTSALAVQIGDSGGIEGTGYLGCGANLPNAASISALNSTAVFLCMQSNAAAAVYHGACVLTLVDAATNTWAFASTLGRSDTASVQVGAGSKSLSATLDRVRLTTAGGVDTFDAGSVNILYE